SSRSGPGPGRQKDRAVGRHSESAVAAVRLRVPNPLFQGDRVLRSRRAGAHGANRPRSFERLPLCLAAGCRGGRDRESRRIMPPVVKRGFADTSVGQVHYRIAHPSGAPSTRPLVIFHGSPSSSLSLMRLMTHLAETRTVIAFDTMGQGDSCPPPSADITFEDFAKLYAEALASLGPEFDCVDLFGTHTGARIVAEFAISF